MNVQISYWCVIEGSRYARRPLTCYHKIVCYIPALRFYPFERLVGECHDYYSIEEHNLSPTLPIKTIFIL